MQKSSLLIRKFQDSDEERLIYLWELCRITVPWNDPYKDISRKLSIQPELFLVGLLEENLIASVMAGYDGHRGWINYLAVHPDFQRRGFGKQLMESVENELRQLACPKINLQIRESNKKVLSFYLKLGFLEENTICMGKRLEDDRKL